MIISEASVEFKGTASEILIFFPCKVCGHRILGNYCSNCGEKATEITKLDFIRVHPKRAASILKKALEDIVDATYHQGIADGVPEKEIAERLEKCFDAPESSPQR